jgi:HlyD family secretion protein
MAVTWIKRLALGVFVIAIIAGFYLALRPKPILVDAAAVIDGPMTVTVDQEGETRVKDIYVVSAPIAGYLDRQRLEEGDAVQANETVVASIHPLSPPLIDRRTEVELRAAVEAAKSAVTFADAQYKQAEADLRLAQSNLQRAEQLSQTSIISQKALDQATNDLSVKAAALDSAKANIGLRQAELASAEAKLMPLDGTFRSPSGADCCVRVTAPVDGVVLKVLVKSEQAVSGGTPLAEIGDPHDLELVVDLLSADAVRIKPGDHAAITDWGGDHPLDATVRRIDPAAFTKVSALGIEEQRVNVILDLDKPETALSQAYRVYARLAVWRSGKALQVPIGALFRDKGEWSVFRVSDGRATLTKVSIGHMNDETAEVLSGLSKGDSVVVHPSDTLADGGLVEQRTTE